MFKAMLLCFASQAGQSTNDAEKLSAYPGGEEGGGESTKMVKSSMPNKFLFSFEYSQLLARLTHL